MPSGTEIHLGFIGPDAIDAAAAEMGLTIYDDEDQPVQAAIIRTDDRYLQLDPNPASAALKEAYEAIADRLGWILVSKGSAGAYHFMTPCGARETRIFSLAIQFDSSEIGDSAEEITLGVNLSARYYPCILDVCKDAQAAGSVQVFDEDTIRICREEIQGRLPAFEKAKVFAREIFY
jgi:hypothetical protein